MRKRKGQGFFPPRERKGKDVTGEKSKKGRSKQSGKSSGKRGETPGWVTVAMAMPVACVSVMRFQTNGETVSGNVTKAAVHSDAIGKFTSRAAVNLPVEIPQRNEGWQLSSVAFRWSGYCGVGRGSGGGGGGRSSGEIRRRKSDGNAIFYVDLAAKRVPFFILED